MPLETLLTAYAALAGFATAMKRHRASAPFLWLPPPRAIRALSALFLSLSMLVTVRHAGWAEGPVIWLGSLCLAAVLLVLTMSWRASTAFALAAAAAIAAGPLAALT